MTTNAQRRKRFKVSKYAPPVDIQTRDIEVLTALYWRRVLTTNQIQELAFPVPQGLKVETYIKICRRRLIKLYHNRYVTRLRKPVYLDVGGVEIAYSLGLKGTQIVARNMGKSESDLEWKPRYSKVGEDWLDHAIANSEARIRFEQSTINTQFDIDTWLEEWELEKRKSNTGLGKARLKKVPDDFAVVKNTDKKTLSAFFLEVDLGTESNSSTILKKIEAYKHYLYSGMFKEDFGVSAFRVLFITGSEKRRDNMQKLQCGGGKVFQVSTLGELKNQNVFTSLTWRVMGEEGRPCALFEV